MRLATSVALLAIALSVADPAMAQSRRKDDSRRVTPREQASSDRDDRRRDRDQETDRRVPQSAQPEPPRRDDRDDRHRYDRDRYDRDHLGPIVVLSPGRRYDGRYESGLGGGVWNRTHGMSCLRLDDELEWAHDEWHYRNDRNRNASWYDVEHARLEWRIAEERAYSRCGRSYEQRDCRDRGHYPRTGNALETALVVLDILLRR